MKGLSFNILKYKAKDFLLRYLKRFFNGNLNNLNWEVWFLKVSTINNLS